ATTTVTIEHAISAAMSKTVDDSKPHPIGRDGLALAAPHFAWDAYFEALGRSDFDDFPISGLAYFSALDELVRQTSPEDVKVYLTLHWYEAVDFVANNVEPSRRDYKCKANVARWMSDAIEPRFLELAGVDDRALAKARALWDEIIATFHDELETEGFL